MHSILIAVRTHALTHSFLQLFLRSLPADCFFNIVGFGSSFDSVFPSSVQYKKKSLQKASAYAAALDAVGAPKYMHVETPYLLACIGT